MDEFLKWVFGIVTSGGIGAGLTAWWKGRNESAKVRSEADLEASRAAHQAEMERKAAEWQRVQEWVNRVDREHTEDRANLNRLHEEAMVRAMELADLRAKLIARDDCIAVLEARIAELERKP